MFHERFPILKTITSPGSYTHKLKFITTFEKEPLPLALFWQSAKQASKPWPTKSECTL